MSSAHIIVLTQFWNQQSTLPTEEAVWKKAWHVHVVYFLLTGWIYRVICK